MNFNYKKYFIVLVLSMTALAGQSQQKVQFHVDVSGDSLAATEESLFKINFFNKDFDPYWVPDTTFLQEVSGYLDLLYVIVLKRADGKYEQYEKFKHGAPTFRPRNGLKMQETPPAMMMEFVSMEEKQTVVPANHIMIKEQNNLFQLLI